jgi:Flp pilus assembly protein TadG
MTRSATPSATRNGQGLVEFALVLPLILLIIFGTIDLGRAVYAFSTTGESARQAARLAIVDQIAVDIKTRAIGSAPVLGLTAADIAVCFKTSGTLQRDCSNAAVDSCSADLQIGCLAVVDVRSRYTPLTPILSSIVGSLTLSSSSIQPIEYVCPTATHATCP